MNDRRLVILFLTIFIDLLGFGVVIPILPNLAKMLAGQSSMPFNSDIAVGVVVGSFSLMQFLVAPIFGSLSDRIGRRPIILVSIIFNVIGYFLFGISGSFVALLSARLVSGFGSANIAAAQAYIVDITPPIDRAKRMGMIGAAFGLGFVFGPPIGGWLYNGGGEHDGIKWVGYFTAALCTINFVLAWFLLPESLKVNNVNRRKVLDTFKGMFKVWRIDIIGELFLINFIYITAFSMMYGSSSVLWKEKYDLSPAGIGNIFGFIGICGAIVQGGLIGFFEKKIGIRNMLIWGCPLIALGLLIIPLPLATDKTTFYVVQAFSIVLLSFGNGLMMPSINSMVSSNTPAASQGQILGLLQGIGSLARAAGPFLAMVLYHMFQGLPYFFGSAFMCIALCLTLMLSKTLRSKEEIQNPLKAKYTSVD